MEKESNEQKEIRASEDRWAKLYAFVQIVSEGELCYGDANGDIQERIPIQGMIRSDRANGTLYYDCTSDEKHLVIISDASNVAKVDRSIIKSLLPTFLSQIKHGRGGAFACSAGSELMELLWCITVSAAEGTDDIRALAGDVNNVYEQPFIVRSLIGSDPLLLGGSSETNFIFCGERPNTPTWSARVGITRLIRTLFGAMRELFGRFSYVGMQSDTFKENLLRIHPQMPAFVAALVLCYYQDNVRTIARLVSRVQARDELWYAFGVTAPAYEHAIKTMIVALSFGMKPTDVWTGGTMIGKGCLILNQDGTLRAYDARNGSAYMDWLYRHTVLETADKESAVFGEPFEQGVGMQCIKLNLQIRLRQ